MVIARLHRSKLDRMTDVRRVLVVEYPPAELLDIACVVAASQLANVHHGSAASGHYF